MFAGNHALKALLELKEAGAEPPTGISQKWEIPCLIIDHLTESQAEAFAIADNRTQELGSNDSEALAELIKSLSVEFDMESVGFNDEALQVLLSTLDSPNFEPSTEDRQDALDQKKPTKCPSCGHEWIIAR